MRQTQPLTHRRRRMPVQQHSHRIFLELPRENPTTILRFSCRFPDIGSLSWNRPVEGERLSEKGEASQTALILTGVNDANEEAKQVRLPIYLCPSDPSPLSQRRNNYRANVGMTAFPRDPNTPRDPPLPGAGAFYPAHRFLYPQHFSDGLSQTVAFSEKLAGDGDESFFTPGADFYHLGAVADPDSIWSAPDSEALHLRACTLLADPNPPHESTVGHFWFYAGFTDTWYNHVLGPNSRVPDCGAVSGMAGSGIMPARSAHPGGVNSLAMDGAVRFVSDSVDDRVWHALGTRNGDPAR